MVLMVFTSQNGSQKLSRGSIFGTKAPIRLPKGTKGTHKAPKRLLKETKGLPKAIQRLPKGTHKAPKAYPRDQNGSKSVPEAPSRSPKAPKASFLSTFHRFWLHYFSKLVIFPRYNPITNYRVGSAESRSVNNSIKMATKCGYKIYREIRI